MTNHLKNWWQRRKTKHYMKKNWHLFADIFLLLIIIALIISLITINKLSQKSVDTTPIKHVSKIIVGTSTDSLFINAEIEKTSIYSGREFVLHLNLENKGNYELKDLSLSPIFTDNRFSISRIENKTENSNIKIKNNKLILDVLGVDEKLEADFSIVLNAKKGSPRLINWSLKTIYLENNKSYSKNYNLNSLKLITNLKVTAEAYYNSNQGDQLGSGPIPPVVGLPTNYWIFFEIDNQGNDLNNLTVSAKLPAGVTLASAKTLSAGNFSYDESQKRISWSVKNAVTNNGLYQAGFEVQLFPTNKQVGLEPLLLSNVSYIATDSYTGEKLSGRLLDVSTELPFDDINRGQGKVLE